MPDDPIRWLTDEVGCVNNPRAAEYWCARLRDYRQHYSALAEWSPALDPTTIERLICALLGVSLPEDYRIVDFDRPAPRSFFDSIVYRDSRKMLQRIGDAARVSPFLGLEPGGTLLTADELRYLLQALASAGLTRFTYYILNTIDDDVWLVLREFTMGS